MRIIDSVGWIAFFTGDPLAESYRTYVLSQSEVICPTIVIYEVSRKLEMQIGRQAAARAVAQLLKTRVVPLNASLARYASRVGIRLRLSMADAMIYATALMSRATLVTSDAHFEGLRGVELIPRER